MLKTRNIFVLLMVVCKEVKLAFSVNGCHYTAIWWSIFLAFKSPIKQSKNITPLTDSIRF
jgi:hypothetical protein